MREKNFRTQQVIKEKKEGIKRKLKILKTVKKKKELSIWIVGEERR